MQASDKAGAGERASDEQTMQKDPVVLVSFGVITYDRNKYVTYLATFMIQYQTLDYICWVMMQQLNINNMFETTQSNEQNVTLDDVLKVLQAQVDEFEFAMWAMFHDEGELSPYQKQRIADQALETAGYSKEYDEKYRQWGIFECQTAGEIHTIIRDVIEYRKDKAAGNL